MQSLPQDAAILDCVLKLTPLKIPDIRRRLDKEKLNFISPQSAGSLSFQLIQVKSLLIWFLTQTLHHRNDLF